MAVEDLQPNSLLPSVVVEPGGEIGMERTVRTQRSLSKQEEIDEADEAEKNHSPAEVINGKTGEEPSSPPPPSNPQLTNNNNNVLHRSRSQSKVKLLVRSHAVREETSPPPEPPASPPTTNGTSSPGGGQAVQQQPNTAPPPGIRVRHKLRREGSSQGSTDSWEPALSRGNSRENYDGTNTVDLQQFIADTLNRNYKDRMLLLKIEHELLCLAKDSKRTVHKFGQMSSYQRMLVHRVAAFFGMEHNVDPSGVQVIVNTCKATHVPERRFKDFVREDLLLPEEPRRSILKRDSSSFDETGCFKSGDRMLNGESRRSKSFEEREEEYQIARRRIFNREHSGDGEIECMDDLHWETDANGVCPQCEQSGRLQAGTTVERNVRLLKVESYESGETLRANSLRLSVSKSHSFNGYDPPHNTRILTKQDSGSSMSSRISPSSSGYKSQRSDATLSATPSPTATPNLHTQLSSQSGALSPDGESCSRAAVVWAVTDMASVPPGSMLIHPQTGQPYTNPDGSIYHFDPGNPPRVSSAETSAPSAIEDGNKASDCTDVEGSSGGSTIVSSQEKQQAQVQVQSGGQQYDHMGNNHQPPPPPPPPPDSRICHMSGGGGYITGVGQIGAQQMAQVYPQPAVPYPQQYNLMLPPHAPEPPPQYHPVVCPSYVPHQYDPRVPESSPSGDLTTYMMGLSVDNNRSVHDSRSTVYWQSHHLQGGSGNGATGVPVYYAGSGGGARYQHPPAPPPPPPQTYSHPPQLVQPQPPHTHHPTEHTGGCYAPTYTSSDAGCIPYTGAAPSGLHMYYSPPCNNGGQQTGGQAGGYYSAGVGSCASPLVTLQYQQPCTHPTPPHTPQGVCGQFAVYNGCYPSHYAPPNSGIPVAQLFRKPALQVGVRCSSPLRPPYPGSPTVKERLPDEKHPPAPPPPPQIQHPLPVYGIRVVPGEMRLLSNTGRLPFTLQTPKSTHNRKHRMVGRSGCYQVQGRRGEQQWW